MTYAAIGSNDSHYIRVLLALLDHLAVLRKIDHKDIQHIKAGRKRYVCEL